VSNNPKTKNLIRLIKAVISRYHQREKITDPRGLLKVEKGIYLIRKILQYFVDDLTPVQIILQFVDDKSQETSKNLDCS
jgi:hypothetical protein